MTRPIAVFATEEELRRAAAGARATLALSGMEMTPEEEAELIKAVREGVSMEEYLRRVEEEVLWGKGTL